MHAASASLGEQIMKRNRLDELMDTWSEGSLSAHDAHELNSMLRASSEARSRFREAAKLHGLLYAAADSIAIENAAESARVPITSALSLRIPVGNGGKRLVW